MTPGRKLETRESLLATIARLEAELLSSEEHSREGWATASERCAERDEANARAVTLEMSTATIRSTPARPPAASTDAIALLAGCYEVAPSKVSMLATIARLEAELAEARHTAYQRGRRVDQLQADYDAAQSLASSRGRELETARGRIEELLETAMDLLHATAVVWCDSKDLGAIDEMCEIRERSEKAISSAAPSTETEPK